MAKHLNDSIPLYGKYLLLEDRHVSYLVDSKVYDNLFVIVRNLCYNEKFQNAYILKKVYTGWAYYPSLKQFIKKTHSTEHQPGAFMIYLTPNPLSKGIMSTQETISETDLRRPDFINIFINPNDLRNLYFEIFSDVRKNSMIKVKSVADDEFRRRVIGYLDHEFLHIRQMYMTKSGKSALTHQGDQKNELSDYLNNLQVSSETKNKIKRLFYFFMPTEVQARISSSARYFEDKGVRDKARQMLKDEISEQMASLGYSKKYIHNFINSSGVLKGTSPYLMEICIRMTSDLNFMDEIDDIVRSVRDDKALRDLIYTIDTDRKLSLHYFPDGLEHAAGDFKATLMSAIYGVFDRTESTTEQANVQTEANESVDFSEFMRLQFKAHCFRSII